MSVILAFLRRPLKAIDERIGIEAFKLGIVLATVYFVQGMGGLSNIPLLFYFKDVLHFNEAQMQYFSAVTGIAWLVKPLFGFISDRFPIFGYRRKTYMVMMATLAALSWWGLAWMSANGMSDYAALVLVFNLSSLGYAFVDVVCDAIMVERGQETAQETAFVNLQWFALGVAGVIAAFSGGKLQTMIKAGTLSLHWVFVIAGLIPLVTAIVAMIFVNEKRIEKQAAGLAPTSNRIGWSEIKEIATMRTFWLLTAFIFFWKYSPSFGAVFSYYNIDILKFDPMFLGAIGAIDKAVFPLSIILYAGLLKNFPGITAKHYLYASIAIGLIYYALATLFLMPEATLNGFSIGARILSDRETLYFAFLLACGALAGRGLKGRTGFILMWANLILLSLHLSFWFAGITQPGVLGYRSLSVITTIVFGYASIMAFLIPLTLAAELAPKKAEGMTYAYFMALLNISGGFLPDISGAWMFEVLKNMLTYPETTLAFATLHSQHLGAYLVQQSFSLLAPIIGQADFLGVEAYRALILRYALIVGVIFTLISIPFVYLLPDKKPER
ncbi:MAG: MFS transporter [Candidatus Niyogibacteria bacterium]|nr:MFS transporter [Candidatus Niyogibacteria bacterium]